MKYIFILLVGLGMSAESAAQTLLDHAKALINANIITKGADNKVKVKRGVKIEGEAAAIFQKYLPAGDTLTEYGQLVRAFSGNPFFQVEDVDQNIPVIDQNFKQRFRSTDPSSAPTSSGFSVASFADGLSRFLVKRTKQELSQAFFDDFKNAINKEPLLGHFCPATKQHLLFIDQNVYQLNNYLEGLRESFTMDMTALPGSTEHFLRDPELCKDCDQSVDGKILIDFLHLAQQMVDGEPPIDMIEYLAQPEAAMQSATRSREEAQLYNASRAFRFLHIVSESLRNPDPEDPQMPWYSGREMREMFKDPMLLRLYMGLLWQKTAGIDFVDASGLNPAAMQSILAKASGSAKAATDLFDSWHKSIESLGELTHSLQRAVHAGKETPEARSDDFFRYTQSLTELLQSVNQTSTLVLGPGNELLPKYYLQLMQQCNSLYFNVRQRNYTGAISNVIYCLNVLLEKETEKLLANETLKRQELEKNRPQANTAMTAAEKQAADKRFEKECKDIQKKGESKRQKIVKLLKYANFAASIAEANSPEEIESAIELFALPPGSSRMKKQPGRLTVALNAYTGLALGSERLVSNQMAETKTIAAVTAPVGISCSWGLGKWGSLGFFVPLLDVGAVTAYRFDNKNTGKLPELTWENILTPGLYGVLDMPGRIPLALGVGWQVGPDLRKVNRGGIDVEESGTRWGAFLAVDIPITYFYLGKGKR